MHFQQQHVLNTWDGNNSPAENTMCIRQQMEIGKKIGKKKKYIHLQQLHILNTWEDNN